MELNETMSRVTKTVTASAEGYDLTATAVIENGKIVNMNGRIESAGHVDNGMTVRFESYRSDDNLVTAYYNFTKDDRHIVDIFNRLIDAVVDAYEVAE